MTNYNEHNLIKELINKRKQYGYKYLDSWEKLLLNENKKEKRRRDRQFKHEILTDPNTFEYKKMSK